METDWVIASHPIRIVYWWFEKEHGNRVLMRQSCLFMFWDAMLLFRCAATCASSFLGVVPKGSCSPLCWDIISRVVSRKRPFLFSMFSEFSMPAPFGSAFLADVVSGRETREVSGPCITMVSCPPRRTDPVNASNPLRMGGGLKDLMNILIRITLLTDNWIHLKKTPFLWSYPYIPNLQDMVLSERLINRKLIKLRLRWELINK